MPTLTRDTTVPRRSKRKQAESPLAGYLTTAQIAERYNVWQDHVGNLIRSGKLPAVRVGWQYLVKEEDWLKYEESLSKKGAPRGPRSDES